MVAIVIQGEIILDEVSNIRNWQDVVLEERAMTCDHVAPANSWSSSRVLAVQAVAVVVVVGAGGDEILFLLVCQSMIPW